MHATPSESRAAGSPPPLVAISGVVFSVLYITTIVLIRLAVPADPSESGAWLADDAHRRWIYVALYLVPFAGIAFLWFMAVLRNRIGLLEDRFFSTIFLGSGVLFVGTLFAAAAASQGLYAFGTSGGLVDSGETYRAVRGMTYALMVTFSLKMAAAFMFATSTIGLRTSVFSRWVSFVGFAFGIVLLLAVTEIAWVALLFPCWVLLVSTWILYKDFHQDRGFSQREELAVTWPQQSPIQNREIR